MVTHLTTTHTLLWVLLQHHSILSSDTVTDALQEKQTEPEAAAVSSWQLVSRFLRSRYAIEAQVDPADNFNESDGNERMAVNRGDQLRNRNR